MRKFTAEDDQYLWDNYLTMPAKRMSINLNRSESCARQRMKLLGIVVPPDVVDRFRKASQIQPGSVPPNKGKRQIEYMSKEAIDRTAKTRFKAGHEPKNTKYDGYERISKDGYIEIRIKKGVFRAKHRVEWEKVYGKIKAGHILVCRGTDIKDCNPDNWEMISYQENMDRNSGVKNLPDTMVATYLATSSRKLNKDLKLELLNHPDLLQAKRTEILLNRQITKIINHGKK